MRTSDDRVRRSGGGGDRDRRLRIAALANGRDVVRVLGSASLRADAVDRRRAPFRVGSISVQNEDVRDRSYGEARSGQREPLDCVAKAQECMYVCTSRSGDCVSDSKTLPE